MKEPQLVDPYVEYDVIDCWTETQTDTEDMILVAQRTTATELWCSLRDKTGGPFFFYWEELWTAFHIWCMWNLRTLKLKHSLSLSLLSRQCWWLLPCGSLRNGCVTMATLPPLFTRGSLWQEQRTSPLPISEELAATSSSTATTKTLKPNRGTEPVLVF